VYWPAEGVYRLLRDRNAGHQLGGFERARDQPKSRDLGSEARTRANSALGTLYVVAAIRLRRLRAPLGVPV